MSKHHIPESHNAHPNVTPLIDIIMCLIIFFMLVAKIGVTTGAEKVDVPATVIGSKIDDMSNTLTLNIPRKLNDNDPVITALVKPAGGGDAVMTNLLLHDRERNNENQLLNTLNYYRAQDEKDAKDHGTQPRDMKVIIRADANLDWRFIEPVWITCSAAGVRSINFDTAKAKE